MNSRCTWGVLHQTIANFDDVSTFTHGQDKEYLIVMTSFVLSIWKSADVIEIYYSLVQNSPCASTVNDRTVIGNDDDVETVVEPSLQSFNQRRYQIVQVCQRLVHLKTRFHVQFLNKFLHATRCNKITGFRSNMLESLQLLQRVACKNCTQQLHMKPWHVRVRNIVVTIYRPRLLILQVWNSVKQGAS